jgi:lysozyme
MTPPILQTIVPFAQASHRRFYPRGPFVSVSLAQFGLESAWGTRLAAPFNPFGIKANATQIADGDYKTVYTKEQRPDGSWYTIEAPFAAYEDWGDAFDAHATLLTMPHYADCIAAQTPEDYCFALQKDGYATAHVYATSLIQIIHSMNLKQYDQTPTDWAATS